jgi:serine/threonine-protein kinase RsbW
MNAGAVGYTLTGCADAPTVSAWRDALNQWLTGAVSLSDERICDILLACGEALANSAEHAYRNAHSAGTVDLNFTYHRAAHLIDIVVRDRGNWTQPPQRSATSVRGRGLPLMRALADSCAIDARPGGTTVRMQFRGCPPTDLAAPTP